jgi:putative transposase
VGVLYASTSPLKERYAVSKDNIIKLIQPGNVDDQLTEILRNGARALLAQAIEAEVADFLGKHADLKTEDGHQRVVRHGQAGTLLTASFRPRLATTPLLFG